MRWREKISCVAVILLFAALGCQKGTPGGYIGPEDKEDIQLETQLEEGGQDVTVTEPPQEEIIPVPFWKTVSAGSKSTCANTLSKELFCWGENKYGQLGVGGTAISLTPKRVGTFTDWSYISVGDGDDPHACGIRSGSLWCWGRNSMGQLGNMDSAYADKDTPQHVGVAMDWAMVSAAGRYTCSIKTDGSLYCFGSNGFGQLGIDDSSVDKVNTPEKVGDDFAFVSTGTTHACAVKTDGTMWCWGDNTYGQLGIGSKPVPTTPYVPTAFFNQYAPVQVGSDLDWTGVSVFVNQTCAVKENGTLWCWGMDNLLSRGDGDYTPTYSPVKIGDKSDWVSVAVGGAYNRQHACGKKNDMSLWCWGDDEFGQVGNGGEVVIPATPETYVKQPELIGANYKWSFVSAGSTYTCAITKDSELFCWGNNVDYQLGDGTSEYRSVPTLVPKPGS